MAENRGSGNWLRKVPQIPLSKWWLGAVIGLTVGVAVALGAVGDLLVTLHPADMAGRGLSQSLGSDGVGGGVEAARATFETWREFDLLEAADRLPSAFTVAQLWLIIDYAFLILYTISVLAIAGRAGPLRAAGTRNTLGAVRLLVMLVAFADIVENSLAFSVVAAESLLAGLHTSLTVVRWAKVSLFALLIVFLLLLVVRRTAQLLVEDRVRQGLIMARTQIIVVAVIGFAFWYEHSSDVLLDLGTTQALATTLMLALLCGGIGLGARALIDSDRVASGDVEGSVTSETKRRTGRYVAMIVVVALGVVGWLADAQGLWGAAIVFGLVLATSWVLQGSQGRDTAAVVGRSTARLPAILGAAPLAVFGIGLIHWTLWADIVLKQFPFKAVVGLVLLVVGSALIPWIGWAVVGAQENPAAKVPLRAKLASLKGDYRPLTWGILACILVAPFFLLILVTQQIDVRTVGPLALVFGAAATLNAVGTGLVGGSDWWRDNFGLPSLFKALRLRRIPVYLLLGLWLFINASLFAEPGYYDARIGGDNERVVLEDAYEDWKATHAPMDGSTVPLVIVAAEGGGLRAAYWTEQVLTETLAASQLRPFALSGTSGGSVGIASYLAKHEPLGTSSTAAGIGLADVADPDYLSATLQRWFTSDLLHTLFRLDLSTGDRSVALADAFTSDIPALTSRYDYAAGDQVFRPLTAFNASDLQDGCLAPISTLSDLAGPAVSEDGRGCLDPDRQLVDESGAGGFPGAVDIVHTCRGQGLTFVDAAINSARFPYVTPAGRIENCGDGVFYLGDGGYVDNSGAMTAAVLLERLEPLIAADNAKGDRCIVPILLQIDNGAEGLIPGGQAAGDPSQLTVVVSGIVASNSARHDRAKVAAATLVQQPLVDADGDVINVTYLDPNNGVTTANRYLRVFPVAQAGHDATVGWLLSTPSKDMLDNQLQAAVRYGKNLLSATGNLSCR